MNKIKLVPALLLNKTITPRVKTQLKHNDGVKAGTSRVKRNHLFTTTVQPQLDQPIIKQGIYPFKYFKISLIRGSIGLSSKIKQACLSLGLKHRFQVVLRRVDEKHAGLILKVKELVKVELVNEIPREIKVDRGWVRVS